LRRLLTESPPRGATETRAAKSLSRPARPPRALRVPAAQRSPRPILSSTLRLPPARCHHSRPLGSRPPPPHLPLEACRHSSSRSSRAACWRRPPRCMASHPDRPPPDRPRHLPGPPLLHVLLRFPERRSRPRRLLCLLLPELLPRYPRRRGFLGRRQPRHCRPQRPRRARRCLAFTPRVRLRGGPPPTT